MFSEIVKIIPSVDRAAMNRMFNTLSARFSAVTKKFSAGMKGALKFGGLAGIGGALLSKLVNPLQKAEDTINRILAKADDAEATAQDMGTSSGKLLRLEALGQAKGVDDATMRQLLGKFQSALADEKEAAKDKTKPAGTLRAFVGETDMADAFFKFMQSTQNLDPSRRVVVQNEVFGEKVRGKASELFNTTPEDLRAILIQLPSVEALGAAAAKLGALADKKDLQAAIRDAYDFTNKPKFINSTQIDSIDQKARHELRGENQDLARFNSLKAASNEMDKITEQFDKLATQLTTTVIPLLTKSLEGLNMITDQVVPAVTQLPQKYTDAVTPYRQWEAEQIDTVSKKLDEIWGDVKGWLKRPKAKGD